MLEDVEAVLAVRIDAENPRVGEEGSVLLRRKGLKSHSLLEVEHVELDLVGRVTLTQAVHDHRYEVGLPLAHGAGDQRVVPLIELVAEGHFDRRHSVGPDGEGNAVAARRMPDAVEVFDVAEGDRLDRRSGEFQGGGAGKRDEVLGTPNVKRSQKVALGVPDGRVFQVAVLAKFKDVLVDAQRHGVNEEGDSGCGAGLHHDFEFVLDLVVKQVVIGGQNDELESLDLRIGCSAKLQKAVGTALNDVEDGLNVLVEVLKRRFELLLVIDVQKDLLAAVVELLEWSGYASERVVKDDDLQLPARGALEGSRYQGLGKSDRGLSDEGVLDPDIAFPDEVEASVGKTDLVGSFLFHEMSNTYGYLRNGIQEKYVYPVLFLNFSDVRFYIV